MGSNLTASVKLTGWTAAVSSSAYAITQGSVVQAGAKIATDAGSYVAGSEMTVTVTLKDGQGNGVTGQKATLTAEGTTLTVANATAKADSEWIDNSNGTYSRTYIANTVGSSLTASVKLSGWTAAVSSSAYAITQGDANGAESSLSISTSRIVANNNATSTLNTDNATLTLSVLDAYRNGVTGLADKIKFIVSDSNGAVVSTGVTVDKIAATSGIDGQYTARVYGNVTGTYTIKVKIDDAYLGSLSKQLVLYTYSFALNTTTKSIIVDGTYQFIVQATPTDTGTVEDVSGVTWRSGNTSVATVASTGITKGIAAGDTTITATGTYNGLDYNLTADLTVKGAIESPTYGSSKSGDTSKQYIIEPPSYSLSIRSGSIIDAVGTTESITGGTGGYLVTINNVNTVKSIQVTVGTWNGASNGPYLARLIFNMSDGSSTTSGNLNGVTNTTVSTFTIPDGYVLQGIVPGGSNYIRTIKFITMPTE